MGRLPPVTREVRQQFQARRDRMLERAAAWPILAVACVLLGFHFWDRWLDPIGAALSLPIRSVTAAALLPLFYLLRTRRVRGLGARALHGGVFLIGILGVSAAVLQLRDGLLWGAPGVLMFPLLLAFYPLPARWFLGFSAVALVLIAALGWRAALPLPQLINFIVMYLLSALVGAMALRVLARQQLRLFMLERRHAEEARTDALTGLLNRRHLEELGGRHVQSAARLQRPLSVLMIDLDHFKQINDHYGHEAGDRALVTAAQALRGTLRTVDYLGRWGGEEFAVLLLDAELDQALHAAQRCLAVIADCVVECQGDRRPLSASIGVACRVEGEFFDSLIRRADTALYAAKSAGRGVARAAAPPTVTA